MFPSRRVVLLASLALGLSAAGARAGSRGPFTNLPYAAWSDADPAYRLYPGDEIDITALSAPELNRSLKLAPDGRIDMPLVGGVMAADLSTEALARKLEQAYEPVLARPEFEVSLKAAAPLKVFVGGQVLTPGIYDLVGDMDALQAVMAAGGFRPDGHPGEVVILRRGPDGRAMMRTVNLARALKAPQAERVPLRRFDIVFVPRSGIGEIAAYMSVAASALPFTFSYAAPIPKF